MADIENCLLTFSEFLARDSIYA